MINSITQAVLNMDYSWRDPKTYAQFVPLLGTLIHIIQATYLEPKLILNEHGVTLLSDLTNDPSLIDRLDFSNDEKYAKARKFSLLVGITQFLATCILREILLQTPRISASVGLPVSLLVLTCSISFIAEYMLFSSKTRVKPLCRIQKEGSPTEVCFNIFGPTTPSFSLKDFLRAELHYWNKDLRIKGINNNYPILNANGRLSI